MIKIMAGKPSSEDIKWFRGQKPGVGLCTRKDVTFLEYQALKEIPDVIHGFTTRLGGVSEGDQASMNLSFSQGDDPEAVRENYAEYRLLSASPRSRLSAPNKPIQQTSELSPGRMPETASQKNRLLWMSTVW